MKRRPLRSARTAALKGIRVPPVLAAATLAGVVLALSGCQVASPIQTSIPYQPADGVAVDLGDLQIRDLVVVADAKGGAGILSGLVVNKGSGSVVVTFASGPGVEESTQASIPPGTPTRLSGVEGTAPVTIPSIAAAPGDMVKLIVSTPAAGAPEVSVPVLPPDGYYASITPAPDQTTPAPHLATPAPDQTTGP